MFGELEVPSHPRSCLLVVWVCVLSRLCSSILKCRPNCCLRAIERPSSVCYQSACYKSVSSQVLVLVIVCHDEMLVLLNPCDLNYWNRIIIWPCSIQYYNCYLPKIAWYLMLHADNNVTALFVHTSLGQINIVKWDLTVGNSIRLISFCQVWYRSTSYLPKIACTQCCVMMRGTDFRFVCLKHKH